ncbi:MAG: alpha/beta hydrolase, partial [Rhodoferax sp.]
MSKPQNTANSALRTDPAASLPRWLRWLTGVSAIVGLAVATFLSGPRYNMGNPEPTARAMPPGNVIELDGWLAKAEGSIPGIRRDNQKIIVWHDKPGQKTPWAVVYLHGFSASRLETAPLADEVAKKLGANVFHTRFTGHGLDGNALANATPQDWMADTIEAIQIANSLGDRVLVISVSTGSTLAAWLGATGRGNSIAGHVFISPNFGPKDKRSELLTGPWGQEIAQAAQGPNRS